MNRMAANLRHTIHEITRNLMKQHQPRVAVCALKRELSSIASFENLVRRLLGPSPDCVGAESIRQNFTPTIRQLSFAAVGIVLFRSTQSIISSRTSSLER